MIKIWNYLLIIWTHVDSSCIKMSLMHPHTGYSSPNGFQMVPGVLNQRYSVTVQNAFGPLSEWVGLSMGVNNEPGYVENMDIQTAQSKRRRCNTGTDNSAFLSLSIDDKLAHVCDKINNLEESNRTLVNIAHSVNQNSVQVNQVNLRMNRHEVLLKLLAYKSIDSEARSRRRNLVFHGLAEIKNEDCSY